jgi:drug/metabolite transporter (DMT)-like permease
MKSQAIRADLLMLLAAAIWGFAFVAQREGMETMGRARQDKQNN